MMMDKIKQIAEQFQIEGTLVEAKPFGTGHINETYKLSYDCSGTKFSAVLQRINHYVFKDPPAMMENIARVTTHIRNKLIATGVDDIDRRVLAVINTAESKAYYQDEQGNFWRVYLFVDNGKTYDFLQNSEQAYTSAKMFGQFSSQLIDLPGKPLHSTIVGFHDGKKYLNAFEQTLQADPCNLAVGVKPEIDFVLEHNSIFNVLTPLIERGQIPVRITHNDTKINNIIFDAKTDEALCVIDLDTVMPDIILNDFGDMVRTATCGADEDETDLSKVSMQINVFEKLAQGFLDGTAGFLKPMEKQYLTFAGKLITFEQSIRFLNDYLAGDVYYKTSRPKHNLDRCRTQIKLVRSIIAQQDMMDAIIKKMS